MVGISLVALVASAGGLGALTTVLRNLPPSAPSVVVVQQHLSIHGSALVEILRQRTDHDIVWASDGMVLAAGQVVVCPAQHRLEVLPDGTCSVIKTDAGAREMPHDALLRSLAEAFGPRALAVVLTGMGRDGSEGAEAVRAAGGFVIAQSADTAEHPSMPLAATPAAHLILPLGEIGGVLADVVYGRPLPRPRSELEAAEALFAGPGEIERLLRALDWSATALGPVTQWSETLRIVVRSMLDSGSPMALWLGRELIQIYNEQWRQFLGSTKHPRALTRPASQTWPEIWHLITPMIEHVQTTGTATGGENIAFLMDRNGLLEEVFLTFTYAPIRDPRGALVGIHNLGWDTTGTMLAERRMRALRAVAAETSGAASPEQVGELAAGALASHPADVPFVLLYLVDQPRGRAQLAGAVGVERGSAAAPHLVELAGGRPLWPLGRVVREPAHGDSGGVLVESLSDRLEGLVPAPPTPAGAQPPHAAFLLPVRVSADKPAVGVLVAGLNPHRPFDTDYRGFLDLLAAQIGAAVAQAQSRQHERQQLEKLAELDRAKSEFFANVSHQFRTPLTLMLAPLQEMLQHPERSTAASVAEIELVQRNARRLLRLVSTLLDFSQAEADQIRAALRPVDLAGLTAEVAEMFRTATELAGLKLVVDAPLLATPVWVDPEMWEKIVSHLLSNALKFTWHGSIEVRLRALDRHAELVIRDSGVGIPARELPDVFKRFHQVRDTRGRSQEGTGVGLALVNELVRRHQGRVRVISRPGTGTTFTVWLPLARRPSRETARSAPPRRGALAATMADEAAHWDTDRDSGPQTGDLEPADPDRSRPRMAGARVLVADDNADMRAYLLRLLGEVWEVTCVNDGEQALALVRRQPPDLVLADVMMPKLDGFTLLRAIRSDATLDHVPVVLLTARAGEQSAIEGLLAGADDYILKPFSARELVARVASQLELARIRRSTALREAFLLRLTDALLHFDDPVELQTAAVRLLGEHLGADRVLYGEIEPDRTHVTFTRGYAAPGQAALLGRYRLADIDPGLAAAMITGRAVAVADTADDPRSPTGKRDQYLPLTVGALYAVPLSRVTPSTATITIHHGGPHVWTDDEVRLIEEVAERTSAAVERAETQQRLHVANRNLEEQFQALVDAGGQTVWTTGADGRVVADSPSWRQFTGQSLEEWIGWGWTGAVHPDDRSSAGRGWADAVQAGTPVDTRVRLRHAASGNWHLARLRAVPLRHPDGSVRGWLGTSTDLDAG